MARLKLITGRSTKQGIGISTGKECAGYREAISFVELNQSDMARLGLSNGDQVRLSTQFGAAEVKCCSAEIPVGLAFMAFGPVCNRLIGGETYASGMPDSKHVDVEVHSIDHGPSGSGSGSGSQSKSFPQILDPDSDPDPDPDLRNDEK